jgi:hypothetical protein
MSGCHKEKGTFVTHKVAYIQPGQCDSIHGCPPPTEIVCIVTEKVYNQCKNIQANDDEFIVMAKADNRVVRAECKKVKLLGDPVCEDRQPNEVRITFTYRVKIKVFFENDTSTTLSRDVTVIKNFNVPRAGEEGLNVQCIIPFIECLKCFVKSEEEAEYDKIKTTIVCCLAKLLVITLKATVQLLIPAYGFCPEPPDCEEVLSECLDFQPPWPPFPPQD